ncbi:MAG TPA: carboxypeptidase-like regulatory domain-containing protein, partial [Solirubrobacterales bacterium]
MGVAVTRAVRLVLGLAVCAAAAAVGPAAAMAGSISGTVTAEAGGASISGVRVCQYERNGAVEESCTQTDGSGNYTLGGLSTGSYLVGFSGQPGNLKWADEIYDNKRYSWEAD